MKDLIDMLIPPVVNYLDRDLVGNGKKMIRFMNTMGIGKIQKAGMQNLMAQIDDPNNPYTIALQNLTNELNPNVRKKLLGTFLIKSFLTKSKRIKLSEKLQQNIPWAVLMDPTSACNLNCIGCWAADYSKKDSLPFSLLDRIINEGKSIGTYIYIYSGGEPLMRRKDIIKLCEKHPDCYFISFTNGTLIDDAFAKEVARVGNFAPAISIEGFEETTDFRRGKGTYEKVIRAMDIMRKYGNFFGYSATYTRKNTDVIASDEFIKLMIEKGCRFGWYFTYMPVGSDARTELIVTPEQRAYMYHRIREIRNTQPLFLMDFWNDGEFVGGCIAGGRRYLHINARGDVEPCAFIHYSNVNIKDVSLLEALRQPIFQEYRANFPFNQNHLRPCPCLDNPEKLRQMVNNAGSASTQINDLESVEALTAKCAEHSCGWAPVAEELLKESLKKKTIVTETHA
jgi:MoaA/NifB/PqqE/SkfB family radical SAM enzyme